MRFNRAQRLARRGEFQGVFRSGRRHHSRRGLVLVATPGTGRQARLGISIPKSQIRRAVDRNRIKRVVRESFRHAQGSLSGLDMVVIVRAACLKMENRAIRRELAPLWERARGRE